MSLRFGLLGLLGYQDMTGYDLKKAADATIGGFWDAQASQIYRELNYMEDLGWLTSVIEFQTDRPNRRIYSVTSSGRQAFLQWLLENHTDKGHLNKSVFMMKIFFSGEHSTAENTRVFQQFKKNCEIKLAELESKNKQDFPFGMTRDNHPDQALYWEFTDNFAKAYYKLCLTWANDCVAALEKRLAS